LPCCGAVSGERFKLDVDFLPGDGVTARDLERQIEAKLSGGQGAQEQGVCVVQNETFDRLRHPSQDRPQDSRARQPSAPWDSDESTPSPAWDRWNMSTMPWGIDVSVAGPDGPDAAAGSRVQTPLRKRRWRWRSEPGDCAPIWDWQEVIAINIGGHVAVHAPRRTCCSVFFLFLLFFGLPRSGQDASRRRGWGNVFAAQAPSAPRTRGPPKVWGLGNAVQGAGCAALAALTAW
jgi:hypothetical protein